MNKNFELFGKHYKQQADIELIKELNKNKYAKYEMTDLGLNVDGDVDLSNLKLTKIPIKFNKVTGWFDCRNNFLTSLENSPKEVTGFFDCSNNQITSLENCPIKVDGSFYCSRNQLTSLKYCPIEIQGNFDCSSNQLTSLEYSPESIHGVFHILENNFNQSLDFFLSIVKNWNEVQNNWKIYYNQKLNNTNNNTGIFEL